jgi:membrane protein implicated in regulation of membrane protease activity
MFGSPKMLLWMTLGSAVVAAAVLVTVTGEWWTLLIPLAIHALGTTLVLTGVFKVLGERDKPDPVTQARMDDEGENTATS